MTEKMPTAYLPSSPASHPPFWPVPSFQDSALRDALQRLAAEAGRHDAVRRDADRRLSQVTDTPFLDS